MRLFLIENGLISRHGHHYMEARGFARCAAARGCSTTILANERIEAGIRDELGARPLFTHTPYAGQSKKPLLYPLFNCWRGGDEFAHNLGELSDDAPGAGDILVATQAGYRELCGIAHWLDTKAASARPKLALNFMIDDLHLNWRRWRSEGVNPLVANRYRHAIAAISRRLPPGDLLLSCGGRAFAELMSRIVGREVHRFPLPVCLDTPTDRPVAAHAPLIGFLGHTRPAKGAGLIAAVVGEVLKHHPACRFLLHASTPAWHACWLEELGAAGASPRLTIVEGDLSQEEYDRLMGELDILLLPYRPADYRYQTSGPFTEAMALGKVTLIPEGTWMSDTHREFGGGASCFSRHEPGEITNALLDLLEDYPRLRAQSMAVAEAWTAQAGMRSFVDAILSALA